MGTYGREVSITSLRHKLNWQTLQERRLSARVGMLGKIMHEEIAIPLPSYIKERNHSSRRNSSPYVPVAANKDQFKYSFFPRTINAWNSLPNSISELQSGKLIKNAMHELVSQGTAVVIYPKESTQYLGHKQPLKHLY